MLSPETIKKLKEDLSFQEFIDYLVSSIDELNTIDDLADLTDEQAGQRARSRATAISILKAILAPVVDFYEKKEHTVEEIQKKKKRYGLQ